LSGPHSLWANYTNTNDTSGTAGATPGAAVPAAGADTGVRKWGVGYQHRFSKRTDGKLGYVRLDNDTAANYTLMGLVTTGLTAAQQAGKSQDAWVMLLRHTF